MRPIPILQGKYLFLCLKKKKNTAQSVRKDPVFSIQSNHFAMIFHRVMSIDKCYEHSIRHWLFTGKLPSEVRSTVSLNEHQIDCFPMLSG